MRTAVSKRRSQVVVLAAALLAATAARPAAHDIPADITVHAFVKPEAQRLHLILRVPLRAMRDVNFPTVGPGYLDLGRTDETLRQAAHLWFGGSVELYEAGDRVAAPHLLAARVSLPSDRSFASHQEAMAHVTGPRLQDDERLMWDAALLDVLFEYPIRSDRSDFAMRLDFRRLAVRVVTVLRFVPPGGAVRAFEYAGDPGLIRLDPRWHQAAVRFVELGFFHILDGIDHLLFLLCLVIPFRRLRPLVLIVTAFTVAHSITLIASAFGLAPDALWFPPLVETLIAMSIVYMALENIVLGSRGPLGAIPSQRRWILAFAFGLVHGFGFSFALRETLQFAGSHLLTSLLSFNLGVELGQFLVLALLIPLLHALFRFVVAERIGAVILSALVAHTAWHWMIERGGRLRVFPWPSADAASLAGAMRWLMLIVLVGGILWGLSAALARQARRTSEDEGATRPRAP